MLCGDGWAFHHVPKCGGTALRSALSGKERGRRAILGDRCPILSPWHRLPEQRPIGCVFMLVRRPSDWIRSWWADQSPERVGHSTWLHQFWHSDIDQFALNLCRKAPGYVGRLYRPVFEDTVIYRLEDGIERAIKSATGLDVTVPKMNRSRPDQDFSEHALAAIESAESEAMDKFDYARIAGR